MEDDEEEEAEEDVPLLKEVLQTSQRKAVTGFKTVQVSQAILISSSSSSSPEDMSCISDGSGVLLRDLLEDVEDDDVEDDLVVEADVEVEEEEEEEGLGCLTICLDRLALANSASKEFWFAAGGLGDSILCK